MKRQIILTIDCDDLECRDCPHQGWTSGSTANASECFLFDQITNDIRCPLCLAAEAKWRAVVEAGNIMGNLCGPHTNAAQAWISAVEEAGK